MHRLIAVLRKGSVVALLFLILTFIYLAVDVIHLRILTELYILSRDNFNFLACSTTHNFI